MTCQRLSFQLRIILAVDVVGPVAHQDLRVGVEHRADGALHGATHVVGAAQEEAAPAGVGEQTLGLRTFVVGGQGAEAPGGFVGKGVMSQ